MVAALAGVGPTNAAINYVFDTTAPPTPCSISGSTYGNTVFCTSSTAPTPQLQTVTGWANTGSYSATASPYGTLESAYIVNYGGGLGVTNRDGASTSAPAPDPNEGVPGSTSPPEHAIDNNRLGVPGSTTDPINTGLSPGSYIYDSVMLTFASDVSLTGVTIGWSQTDSDITVLAYQGAAGGEGLSGRNYANLTASNDWKLVGHYSDLATNSLQLINGASNADTTSVSSVSSRYWLIGAYNPLVGSGGLTSQWTTGNDFVKLLSVTGIVPGQKVPEPASRWLVLAVLGAGGWMTRSQRSATKQ